MIRNGTKTDHLEHLGDLGPEIIQNGTRTDHLEYLGGLSPEMSRFGSSKPLETRPTEGYMSSKPI